MFLIVLLTLAASASARATGARRSPHPVSPFHRYHHTAKPKWVNPCGMSQGALRRLSHAFGKHYQVRPLTDAELLENVILAAKNALRHSRVFKEDYVS